MWVSNGAISGFPTMVFRSPRPAQWAACSVTVTVEKQAADGTWGAIATRTDDCLADTRNSNPSWGPTADRTLIDKGRYRAPSSSMTGRYPVWSHHRDERGGPWIPPRRRASVVPSPFPPRTPEDP
ncbi:hypothetical protein ABIA38_003298 [Embleya sp. AB8]